MEIQKERKWTGGLERQVSGGLSVSRAMGTGKVGQNCSW